MKISVHYLLLFALILSGCSQSKSARAGIDPLTQNKAAPEIEKSFVVKALSPEPQKKSSAGDLWVDNSHVMIKKAALGKEFLLSVNLLSQTPTPMFSSLQSRVVSFVLRDQKIYLLDVTKNNVISNDTNIPNSLLITEFPIIAESGDAKDSFEIDFNSGMRQIFDTRDMSTSADPDSETASYSLSTTGVRLSYLDEVKLSDSALFIRQIAQIDGPKGPMPAEVRYQIKPYLPDPDFVPMKSPGLDKVGFFEANPLLLADGSTRVYAMKWNEKKAIKFAISANTPVKYRELVKSALLYWNKILGEKAIEVVQLDDESITAPRFDLNIIQWAEWDAAESAFADAHVDPRSGQVTSAQIFMPSVFAKDDALHGVRTAEAARPKFGLKGFKSSRLCNRNLREEFSGREKSEGATVQATEKATRDFVYETIAHELGHVLGLRHNFAGSLAANYDFKDRKNLIKSYYKNMKAHPGVIASNSVMDYSRFEESSWNGDLLQNGPKALSYDEMAIKFLYMNTAMPLTNRPLFCTDSDVRLYADCNKNDAGRSVVSMASGAYQHGLNTLAARIINIYLYSTKVKPDLATALVPVSEVSLSAKSMAKSTGTHLGKLLSVLKTGTHLIAVRGPMFPILTTGVPEVEKAEAAYLTSEFSRLGGIEALTKELSENFETELLTKFSELLEDPLFNSGKLKDNSEYSFSSDEIDFMKKQVALFAPQLREQLILNEIKALSGENFAFADYGQSLSEIKQPWEDSDLTYALSGIAAKRFIRYAMAKTSEKLTSEIIFKDGSKKSITLPIYSYPESIRIAAPALVTSKYKVADGGYLGKKGATTLLEAEFALIVEPEKINMLLLDRPILQWLLINKKLAAALL